MLQFFYFLHVIGAVGMGLYILLPFMVRRIMLLSSEGQAGFVEGLIIMNRIAQFCLIIQLATGGYMMMMGKYSTLWIVLTILIMLGLGALGGIMAKPLKLIVGAAKAGESAASYIARVRLLSILLLVLYVAIIFIMQYPS